MDAINIDKILDNGDGEGNQPHGEDEQGDFNLGSLGGTLQLIVPRGRHLKPLVGIPDPKEDQSHANHEASSGQDLTDGEEPTVEGRFVEEDHIGKRVIVVQPLCATIVEPTPVRGQHDVEDDPHDARDVARAVDTIAGEAGEGSAEEELADDGLDDVGLGGVGLDAEADKDCELDDDVCDADRVLGLGVEEGDEEGGDPLGVEADADADAVEV